MKSLDYGKAKVFVRPCETDNATGLLTQEILVAFTGKPLTLALS